MWKGRESRFPSNTIFVFVYVDNVLVGLVKRVNTRAHTRTQTHKLTHTRAKHVVCSRDKQSQKRYYKNEVLFYWSNSKEPFEL